MGLNLHGHVAEECWRAIPAHFPNVELGAYAIMPNHVHGIIVIHDNNDDLGTGTIYRAPTDPAPTDRAPTDPAPTDPAPTSREQFGKPVIGSIPTIIRTFKAAVTREIGRQFDLHIVWQRNYYEHVIRSQAEWDRIHRYIESNPVNWKSDKENRSEINPCP
jgi:REP element-mobilizing transposase RayT